MKHIRKTLLATALAATGLAMAAPASAGLLQIRVTDPTTSTSFICVDNAVCDASNTIGNEIVLDTLAANAFLGLGSAFNIASLAAQSNFVTSDPLVSNITGSGSIEADATLSGPRPLIIEFSQTDWFKPTGNPRTLSVGSTVTFTNSGQGDTLGARGYNDAANELWSGNNPFDGLVFDLPAGAADDFVTSQVLLSAGSGAPQCGPEVGGIQTCAGQAQLDGIFEDNPFSLSQRVVISLGPSDTASALNTVGFSNSVTKFASLPVSVAEPASMLLLGAGLFGVVAGGGRKKSAEKSAV